MRFRCKIGWHCKHMSDRDDKYIPRYHGKFKTGATERTYWECCKCGLEWYEERKYFWLGGRF